MERPFDAHDALALRHRPDAHRHGGLAAHRPQSLEQRPQEQSRMALENPAPAALHDVEVRVGELWPHGAGLGHNGDAEICPRL